VAVALLLGVALGAARVGELRWTHADGAPLRVALLQGDVAQSQKFRPESLAPTLRLYGGWLDRLQADLILTPETALPVLPEELPPHYLDDLQRTLRSHGTDALVGIPLTRGADGYTNSVIGLGDARPYRYDKAHLVPFGEFIPYGFHWFVRLMNMPLGDFARGRLDQPSFEVRGRRIAPTICYEDLFGEQLAQRFAVPAQAPNVIANLTNLAWFGDTIALPQHLQIARMRSLEFQLPSIRATNTGVTAIIDARGRVTGQLAPYTAGVLLGSVQPAAGVTPYAWLAARLGYAPIVLLGLLALALAAAAARALPTIRD
jgi:apolipoprotein N-acyltransferase